MKRTAAMLCVIVLLVSGCRTIVDRPVVKEERVLPDKSQPESLRAWTPPRAVGSVDEAMANIKNLQNNLEFEGMTAQSIDIDKFGMRAHLAWDESKQHTVTSDTTGGTFIYGYGWIENDSSTQTNYDETVHKEKAVILSFNEINQIEVGGTSVYVSHKSGEESYVKADNPYHAQLFADSLYTVSIHAFATPPGDVVGIRFRDLSAAQKKLLGIDYGKLITLVMKGSPADRAGIKCFDILTQINGTPLNGGEVRITVGEDETFRFLRWTESRTAGGGTTYEIEEFDTTVRPEARK